MATEKSLIDQIAEKLEEKGYAAHHVSYSTPKIEEIKISIPQPSYYTTFIGLRRENKREDLQAGTLFLEDKTKGASLDKNWVLEVSWYRSREEASELTELVKGFSVPRGIDLKVNQLT